MAKKDIFKEPLHPIEGVQEFSQSKAKGRIRGLPKPKRREFCVVKETKPDWYSKDMAWKQTYSVQRADKMKELGRKCSGVKK